MLTNEIMMSIGGVLLLTNLYTGVTSWSKGKDIETQAQTIEKLKAQKEVHKSNEKVLISTIIAQNESVEKLAVDLNTSMNRWDNREPVTVFVDKWKTEYIDRNITVEVTKDECEDSKRIANSLIHNGL